MAIGSLKVHLITNSGGRLKMVKIISDSTCDLSQELLDKYEISILPLHILKMASILHRMRFITGQKSIK